MPENIDSQVAREQARRGNAQRLLGTDRKGRKKKAAKKKPAHRTSLKNKLRADPGLTSRERALAAIRSRRKKGTGGYGAADRALAKRENLLDILF